MKICHIINDMHSGGAQTFLSTLAKEQVKLGHEVVILLLDKSTNTAFEQQIVADMESREIKVYTLDRRRGKNFSILKSLRTCHELLKKVKPDVINSHMDLSHFFIGLYLFFFRQTWYTKHVVSIHCAPEPWDLPTTLLNRHSATIFCSYAAEKLNKKRDCISVTIQNGISDIIADDSAAKLLETRNINGKEKLVLCVGRIAKQKNYSFISSVADEFVDKEVRFLVCGAPDNTYEVVSPLLHKKPIEYLGVCTPSTIFSLMKRSHCFLNASLYEGLPITVLEAFFSGIPCVLSSIMPHHEIASDMPNCYIPESFDTQKYKEAINIALSEGDMKSSILKDRLPRLDKYRIHNTASRYVDFYQLVLKSGN